MKKSDNYSSVFEKRAFLLVEKISYINNLNSRIVFCSQRCRLA